LLIWTRRVTVASPSAGGSSRCGFTLPAEPHPYPDSGEQASELRRGGSVHASQVGPFKLAPPPSTPSRAALEWEMSAIEGGASGAWLDTTFLDYDLRIVRGHRGDLYILTRED
jgi:hypothetical protein